MPPRRSHKKSRAGCRRCKIRKIKCDEIHPRCGNCVKHGVLCDFDPSVPASSVPSASPPPFSRPPQQTRTTSKTTETAAAPSSAQNIQRSPSPTGDNILTAPQTSRILELKLVHFFSTKTARSLAPRYNPDMLEVWEVGVPERAFATPFLLDAMLAVAALHLRSLGVEESSSPELIRASHGYMASALSQYSSRLTNGVHAENAEAMFLTGTLVAFQISASRRFADELDAPNGYTLPVQWFHAFQGLKALVLASWAWLSTSDCVRRIVNSQPTIGLDENMERPTMFDCLLDDLNEELLSLDESVRLSTQQAYEHAVAYLTWAVQREPEQGSVLAFPATVTRRFVDLFEQRAPRALCITACFFAMTRACDGVWWLRDAARREVKGLMTFIPPEWWPKITWAMRLADAEGPIDVSIWGYPWKSHVELAKDHVGLSSHYDILTQVSALSDTMSL